MSAKQSNRSESEQDVQQKARRGRVSKREERRQLQEQLSKTERQRLEREERIRSLQSKDGGKKPIKTGPKRSTKVLSWTVGILVVLGIAVWFLTAIGLPQRYLPALRVGNENVSILEYNYYYHSLKAFYEQNMGGEPIDEDADALFSDQEETWGEFFDRMTEASIQETYILVDLADEAGFAVSEEGKDEVQLYFDQLGLQVGGELAMENYLELNYGKGARRSSMTPIMERQRLASEYSNEIPDGYNFTDEEIEALYEENSSAYDLVTYHQFSLRADTSVDEGEAPLSDEEKEEIIDEVRELAEAALEEVEDADSFRDVAEDYQQQLRVLQAENKGDLLEDEESERPENDPTRMENRKKNAIFPTSVGTWVFEDERTEGDTELFDEGEVFYIVYFEERVQDTRPVPSIRVTLFPASVYEGATLEQRDEAFAAAEALAEEISSEQDLLDLDEALENDSYEGDVEPQPSVLVEDVSLQTGLEQTLSDWAIATDREVGDITALKGNMGSYTVVVTSINETDDQQTLAIRYELAQEKYSEDMEAWIDDAKYAVTRVQPWYRFVG